MGMSMQQKKAERQLMCRLVNVHTYSAEALPFGRELISAEEEAKKAQKNVS